MVHMAKELPTEIRWICSVKVLLLAVFIPRVVAQCDIPPLQLNWGNTTVTQDGLGVARGFELGIGSPQQVFSFRPSTTFNNTRVNNILSCGSATNNSCIGRMGGGFDSSQSKSFAVSIKSQWNGSQIDDESPTGSYVYFNDVLEFKDGGVNGMPVVMDSEDGGGEQSSLPLGTNSSFLRAAVEGKVAPSEVWGLWAGSRGMNPKDGLLTIGGFDEARVAGDFSNFPVGNWSLDNACPLQATIIGISYDGKALMNGSTQIIACVEPALYKTVFPPDVGKQFAQVSGQDSKTFTDGFQYDASKRPTGNLTITLAGGYVTTIPNSELFLPVRTSDDKGRFVIQNDTISEAQLTDTRDQDPSTVIPTLGGQFLTYNYLMVDYSDNHFHLAPAVPLEKDVTSNPKTICTPSTSSSKSSGSHTAAVVGGIIGAVAGLAILTFLIFCLVRQKSASSSSQSQSCALSNQGAPYGTSPPQGATYGHGTQLSYQTQSPGGFSPQEPAPPVLQRQLSELDSGYYEMKVQYAHSAAPARQSIYEMPTARYSGPYVPRVMNPS